MKEKKEVRFTRNLLGFLFGICCVLITCIFFLIYMAEFHILPFNRLGLIFCCVLLFFLFIFISYKALSQTYILFSPLGLEHFRFLNPKKDPQVYFWQEINSIECVGKKLIMELDDNKVEISLLPMRKSSILYLIKLSEEIKTRKSQNSVEQVSKNN